MKDQAIEVEGVIVAARGGIRFQVQCETHTVRATVAGKLQQHFIHLVAGDKVRLELSLYELSKGRITRRL